MDFLVPFESELQILGQVALAMLLGAIIGLERETKDKPAGLRTHMLVSGAAALLVSLGDVVINFYQLEVGGQVVQSDPIRIMEAVITGVSFLGAGTIIRHRGTNQVEGLTTAASILFVTGLGICVALSQIPLAVGAALLSLITLRGVSLLRRWLIRWSDE